VVAAARALRFRVTLASVPLFDALYAFFQEHRRCGDLDGDVGGVRVWMTCLCGAALVRVVAFS
jgi:hypothetical protein